MSPIDAIKNIVYLLNDDDPSVRKGSVQVLRSFSSVAVYREKVSEVIPTIVELLETTSKPFVRVSALEALAAVSQNINAVMDFVTSAVVPLLNDYDPGVRKETVEVLRSLSNSSIAVHREKVSEVIPTIVELLEKTSEPFVRVSALEALAAVSQNSTFTDSLCLAIPAVVLLLDDGDPGVRKEAVETLRSFSHNGKSFHGFEIAYQELSATAVFKETLRNTISNVTGLLEPGAQPDFQVKALKVLANVAQIGVFEDAISKAISAVINLQGDKNLMVQTHAREALLILSSKTAFAYKIACTTTDFVLLKSSDGEEFRVATNIIWHSTVIRNMLEVVKIKGQDEPLIPLPNISSRVLPKVLEYCTYHRDDPIPWHNSDETYKRTAAISEWDQRFITVENEMLFEIIMAANYLDIGSLLNLGCKTVANMIRGRTKSEIRELFGLTNEITPEEEAIQVSR